VKLPVSKRSLLVAAGLVLGGVAVSCVVREAGGAATLALMRLALPYLPLALALEGCRILTEVMAAHGLFAMLKSRVPTRSIAKAQFVGYSICNVVPVGRVACEAAKAGILSADTSLSTTAAVGAVTQALHLIASAVVLVPCFLAARSAHASLALSAALGVQCGVLLAVGGAVFLAAYFVPASSKVFSRIPRLARALLGFRSSIRQLPRFPLASLSWLVLTRVLQVVLIAVLARALASPLSVAGAFVAQGVLQTGASAFDFVPGQIGALEGLFKFFAAALGTSPSNAVAIALLLHVVQACWVLVGAGILTLGSARRRALGRPVPSSSVGPALALSDRSQA
jgi:hypothetical protein